VYNFSLSMLQLSVRLGVCGSEWWSKYWKGSSEEWPTIQRCGVPTTPLLPTTGKVCTISYASIFCRCCKTFFKSMSALLRKFFCAHSQQHWPSCNLMEWGLHEGAAYYHFPCGRSCLEKGTLLGRHLLQGRNKLTVAFGRVPILSGSVVGSLIRYFLEW
jgi:hypothetical protein